MRQTKTKSAGESPVLAAPYQRADLEALVARYGSPLLLIDWEYAAWSDPLLDLAAFASGENLAPEASAELLAGYGPAAGIDPDALRRARVLFDCLNALWLDAADGWRDLAAGARMQLCARLDNPL